MKYCSFCKTEKSENEFSLNKTKKDKLNSFCKTCMSEYKKRHYEANKINIIKKVTRRKNEIKAWVKNYKKNLKCEKCNENHPAVLQFHHLENQIKENNISNLMCSGVSIRKIKEEINKCIVVCANCHFKIHYEQQN